MLIKSITARSHQGPFLESNEDGYDFDVVNGLFMLFDGFGGSNIGDTTVRNLKSQIKKFYLDISQDKDSTLPFFYSPKFLVEGNALINAMLFSHDELMKENVKKDTALRGGASGIIMSKSENVLTIAATGNCIAYLVRHGQIRPIIIPDNYELLSDYDLSNPLLTMPMSGFGLFPHLYYTVKEVRVSEGDLVIALTDGVYARLSETEILSEVSGDRHNLKKKIDNLFSLANNKGNLDNQSAMVLEF